MTLIPSSDTSAKRPVLTNITMVVMRMECTIYLTMHSRSLVHWRSNSNHKLQYLQQSTRCQHWEPTANAASFEASKNLNLIKSNHLHLCKHLYYVSGLRVDATCTACHTLPGQSQLTQERKGQGKKNAERRRGEGAIKTLDGHQFKWTVYDCVPLLGQQHLRRSENGLSDWLAGGWCVQCSGKREKVPGKLRGVCMWDPQRQWHKSRDSLKELCCRKV